MTLPTPTLNDHDLPRVIVRDFGEDALVPVMEILNRYGGKAWHAEVLRVRMACLRCAEGGLTRLGQSVDIACLDYRDILAAAEFPARMRAKTKDERRAAIELDKRQYAEWLMRQTEVTDGRYERPADKAPQLPRLPWPPPMQLDIEGLRVTRKTHHGTLVVLELSIEPSRVRAIVESLIATLTEGAELSVPDEGPHECYLECRVFQGARQIKRGCHGSYGTWRDADDAQAYGWMLPGFESLAQNCGGDAPTLCFPVNVDGADP